MSVPKETNFRYEYPLDEDSVVIDVGAYHGEWSAEMAERYGCKIYAYEPCPQFYEIATKALVPWRTVHLYPMALGPQDGMAVFHIHGSMTGEFAGDDETFEAPMLDISSIVESISDVHHRPIDLLKLNAEGGEFGLLERLLATGQITKINRLQIQWHPVVVDCAARYEAINADLEKIFKRTYFDPWTWEFWDRKQP